MVPEDYVHRIGRTGRAGIDGDAISLVCVDEAPLLRRDRAPAPDADRDRGGRRASSPTARSGPSRSGSSPGVRVLDPADRSIADRCRPIVRDRRPIARARRTAGSRRHPGRAPSSARARGRPNGPRPQGPRPGGPRPIGDPNGSRQNAPWPNGQRPNGPRPHVSGQPAGRSFTAMPGERLARSANHRDDRGHRDERGGPLTRRPAGPLTRPRRSPISGGGSAPGARRPPRAPRPIRPGRRRSRPRPPGPSGPAGSSR